MRFLDGGLQVRLDREEGSSGERRFVPREVVSTDGAEGNWQSGQLLVGSATWW